MQLWLVGPDILFCASMHVLYVGPGRAAHGERGWNGVRQPGAGLDSY